MEISVTIHFDMQRMDHNFELVVWYFTDYDHRRFIRTRKGFLFVLITGAFLYYLMRRYFRIINSYYDSMMETQRTLANLIVNLPVLFTAAG